MWIDRKATFNSFIQVGQQFIKGMSAHTENMGISQVYDGLLAGSEQFIKNTDEHDGCNTVRLVLRVLDDGSAVVRTEAATVVVSSRSELLEAVEKALAGCFAEEEQEAEQPVKPEGVVLPVVVLEHVGRHPGVARAELVRKLVELYSRPSGGVSRAISDLIRKQKLKAVGSDGRHAKPKQRNTFLYLAETHLPFTEEHTVEEPAEATVTASDVALNRQKRHVWSGAIKTCESIGSLVWQAQHSTLSDQWSVSVIESSRYLTETESCNSESEIIAAVVEAANRLLKAIRDEH